MGITLTAMTAKQNIVSRLKAAERNRIVDLYSPKIGELLFGIVRRVDKNNVFLDLSSNESGSVSDEAMILKDNNIDSVTLCKSIPWFLRYDVLPFAIFYGLSFYGADQKDDELYKHYSNIAIPIILTIHLILFL